MIYLLALLICWTTAYLSIRFLTGNRLSPILHILLAFPLGLGLAGSACFYTHILFNIYNRFIPIVLILALGAYLYYLDPKMTYKNFKLSKDMMWGLLTLAVLSIPLILSANHYPLGGWDAWSCWNLKAKFIFLGHANWKDVLAPSFWRSNTQYPLLWPLINVWFWDLSGNFNQTVPMFNSVLIALLTAGLLLFGLLELTGQLLPSILAAVITTAIPFGVTMLISQYSDSLLGLYLLSAFLSLLLAEKYKLPKLKILTMVFLGLLSFAKNEGLVASVICAVLIFWHERRHKKELKNLLTAFGLSLIPTLIFTSMIAPKNEAFVNGLSSTDKPMDWARIQVILAYPLFEFISAKWNGFWLLALGGILLAGKKLWQSTLGVIAISIILYLGVVMAYYAVNTFFEINWWLSTTLSRILFALIPTMVLWIASGLLNLKDV